MMKKNLIRTVVGAAALIAASMAAAPAFAAVEVLNFAGLNGESEEGPANFYNGGSGSLGSTGGPNYGISFGNDTITCNGQPGGRCNTAQIPGGPGANIVFFLTGSGDIMNVAGGFDTGFSFYYSAVNNPGSVNVWSGLNGTGTLLATLNLGTTPNGAGDPSCFGANFCPFSTAGVTFSGTAESVDFTGTQNQIAFADITLGSASAGGAPIPEPENIALMLAGLGLVGVAARRQSRK
jgi:hypothetical protein